MERPSIESGDRGTRGGSEGQVEHPDEDGCGTQESDDRYGSQDLVHGRTPGGVLRVVQEVF